MIIVSNINIAVAIKGGGRPTLLLPHAKMLLVPRKFFSLSLSLSAGYIMLWKFASFFSQSIHLGGVLEDFNKSIHLRKVTRGCDNSQYFQKGEIFH